MILLGRESSSLYLPTPHTIVTVASPIRFPHNLHVHTAFRPSTSVRGKREANLPPTGDLKFGGLLDVEGWSLSLLLAVATLLATSTSSPAAQEDSARQNYVIKVWGADDGLTDGSVTDVAQTPEGYLWVGTLFGSVLRFDGRRFISYNSANTREFLQKWGVPRLMVDNEGTLWISMYDGGMTTWNKQGFRFVFTSTNQPGRMLWSGPGQVLFAYGEGKLLRGKKRGEERDWETIGLPAALPQDQACADAEGRVWYLRSQPQLGIWEDGQSRTCPSLKQ